MLGYIASVLITIAYLPQVMTCYKTKNKGLSNQTLFILLVAMLCWIGYAIQVNTIPLLVSSVLSVLQLLFLAIYPYVKNNREQINT